IDPAHGLRRRIGEDPLRQRAGTATDVEPVAPPGDAKPGDEARGDLAAPAPDIGIVEVAAIPAILRHTTGPTSTTCPTFTTSGNECLCWKSPPTTTPSLRSMAWITLEYG